MRYIIINIILGCNIFTLKLNDNTFVIQSIFVIIIYAFVIDKSTLELGN